LQKIVEIDIEAKRLSSFIHRAPAQQINCSALGLFYYERMLPQTENSILALDVAILRHKRSYSQLEYFAQQVHYSDHESGTDISRLFDLDQKGQH
jgi:hypothetical protein